MPETNQLKNLQKDLRALTNPERAKSSQWFFKTGKGEYGEGDLFLGIRVPEQRKIASKYFQISLKDVIKLLHSKYHEERLTALFILVKKFEKGDEQEKKEIYELYLKNAKLINNWDLVDSSAHKIVGEYLKNKSKEKLYQLVRSESIWERRIAVISTFAYIKDGDSRDAVKLAEILLNDEHDLIHKAVGWMLREVGNRCSQKELLKFLDQNAAKMPRTMLRYAIEKLPENNRQDYLKKKD